MGRIKTMSALRIEFNTVVSEEDEIRENRLSLHLGEKWLEERVYASKGSGWRQR